MQPSFVSTRVSVCLALTVCLGGCANPAPPMPVAQRLYVAYWEQPPVSGVWPVPGVDIDGRVGDRRLSDHCDDVTDYGREGVSGIDNAYIQLLTLLEGTDLGGSRPGVSTAVPVQLQRGEGLIGFDVEPPSESDPAGPVLVTLLEFTSSEPLTLDLRLRLRASGLTATPVERVEATHESGRLRARFASMELPMGPVLGSRPISGVIVDFDIEEDGRIVRANLGARVSLATATAVTVEVTGETNAVSRRIIESLGVADLEPDEEGWTCAEISLGVGLELADAR